MNIAKIFIAICLFCNAEIYSQTVTVTDDAPIAENFGKQILLYQDSTTLLSISEIQSGISFFASSRDVPNFLVSNYNNWIKATLQNLTSENVLVLSVNQPSLDEVTLYYYQNGVLQVRYLDDRSAIRSRHIKYQNYCFEIPFEYGETKEVFLKINSGDQVLVPLKFGTRQSISELHQMKDLWFGIFAGVLAAMLLFNVFLYIRTREREYLSYVFYVVILFLTQANFQGYTLRFVWPMFPEIERYGVFLLSSTVGIVGCQFFIRYINVKVFLPKSMLYFYIVFSCYGVVVLLAISGHFNLAYNILQPSASFAAILVLVVSIKIWKKGVKQAGNLLVAWSIFMMGIIIFVLKDFDVIPTNDFTINVMTIGSAVEGVLLSFGLADKINQLKLEKEESDALRIAAIESQNEVLEVKVHERTLELEDAKDHIQSQYDHLRIAQKQLVESEKLAGLGQMTAGIAHELNNPINFVTSNVGPLHRDIEDVVSLLNDYQNLPEDATSEQIRELKTKYESVGIDYVQKEIHLLLNGIEEGSRRTAEIVRGLRIFARADKDVLVSSNINECLQSTIVVMKSVTKGEVTVTREFDDAMPPIECFPGKLNQVIANLISNATQATKLPGRNAISRNVTVRSYFDENEVCISVKDNGCGISEEVKEKLFVPFFTTKAVGEGTGLGLSIALGIIEEHQGTIEVLSTPGEGSEFIIHLPRTRKGESLSAA